MKTRTARMLAAAVGVVTLGACSPQSVIHTVFGPAGPQAESVAYCESRLDPGARSAGGGNHGLFQINNVHRGSFEQVTGKPWAEVYNPVYNSVFAKWLYDQSGWRPWTCKP